MEYFFQTSLGPSTFLDGKYHMPLKGNATKLTLQVRSEPPNLIPLKVIRNVK